MSAAAAAIEAIGIERRFGRLRALFRVELTLGAGRALALVGPNGAGKTTLLRILAQVLRPSAGTVRIFGRTLAEAPEQVLSSVGFLPHEIALYLDLTPEENLRFFARLHGLGAAEVLAALEEVGLAGIAKPVSALSRGQQQRVALARALLHRPPLWLLDEPWTGLDPKAQALLADRLRRHRQEGGSVVFTTHDLEAARESADQVALLGLGQVVFQASTSELTLAELEQAYARAAGEEAN